VKLRELERGDVRMINAWRTDREVVDSLSAGFAFVGLDVDQDWFTRYLAQRHNNVRLAIIDDDEELVGCVYLLDIRWVHRSAEFAILIGRKDRWKRGIGTWATRVLLRHAFDDLQLQRVWLQVCHTNQAARRLYERTGFRNEGSLRRALFKNGQYVDVDVMAILESEYRSRVSVC
jgi:RimJ/RimL family protein N-acetyltransferase